MEDSHPEDEKNLTGQNTNAAELAIFGKSYV